VQTTGNGNIVLVVIALVALGAGAYFVFGQGDDKDAGSSGSSGDSQGIRIVAGQLPNQPTVRPAQQPQTVPQLPAGSDQIVTLNMLFSQTLVRTEGRCPSNGPAAGFDFSSKTPTKVTINKTKRTIQIENSDGTKSDVATYDAATGLALITFQGVQDNRTSTVKVTDQLLDGESTFFPYRGRQGGEQYNECKFVLKTLARPA
jgi:hypothetical protein